MLRLCSCQDYSGLLKSDDSGCFLPLFEQTQLDYSAEFGKFADIILINKEFEMHADVGSELGLYFFNWKNKSFHTFLISLRSLSEVSTRSVQHMNSKNWVNQTKLQLYHLLVIKGFLLKVNICIAWESHWVSLLVEALVYNFLHSRAVGLWIKGTQIPYSKMTKIQQGVTYKHYSYQEEVLNYIRALVPSYVQGEVLEDWYNVCESLQNKLS